MLLPSRTDGILISVSSETFDHQHFNDIQGKIPIVFFDRVFEDMDAVKITTDDYESAYNATQHLIECGCKKISYLMALNNLSAGKKRIAGYRDALINNNITYNE